MRVHPVLAVLAGVAMALAQSLTQPLAQAVEANALDAREDAVGVVLESAESALGASRGLCIGTIEECVSEVTTPDGFDLTITFDHDSSALNEAARAHLDIIAQALQDERLAGARFVIEGHTDALGPAWYNEKLSERRAQSVASFLLERGVARGKVSAKGYGERRPRVPDPLDPANRRVEMRIMAP